MYGLRQARSMEGNVVGFTAQSFQIDQFHGVRVNKRVRRDDPQTPTCQFAGHGLADLPEANEPQGFARHSPHRFVTMHVPIAALHFLMRSYDAANAGEQKSDRM